MFTKVINFDEAMEVFNEMHAHLKIPSLNPEYIICDSKRDINIEVVFWYAKNGDKIWLHSFFLNHIKKYKIYDIESPYGYGGPISNNNNKDFIRQVKHEFRNWCKNKNIMVEFLKFHPLISNEHFYWGKYEFNRKTVVINLKNNLIEEYLPRRRTDVKSSRKNEYELSKATDLKTKNEFRDLYLENMKNIKAKSFYFFNEKYFNSLFRCHISDIWVLKKNNFLIAGVIILHEKSSKCVEYHLSARNFDYDKANIDILDKVAEYYKKNNYNYFYLGGGRSIDPKDSLLYFKQGFSSKYLDFKIGYNIYDINKYSDLKNKFFPNIDSTKVLFYK